MNRYKEELANKIAETIEANFEDVSKVGNGSSGTVITAKTVGLMSTSVNLQGGQVDVVQSYKPELAYRANTHFHFRDIIPVVESETGMYVFYREVAKEGSVSVQTPHGVPKSQIDYTYTRVAVQTEYLAGYATLAKQMMQDLPFLQTGLPKQLIESYLDAEDLALNSFLQINASSHVPVGATSADKLLDIIRQVEVNGYMPNAIILHPNLYYTLLTTLSASAFYAFWFYAPDGQLYFRGIPVYLNQFSVSSQAYVIDTRQIEIVTTGEIAIDFSYENATNFIQNMVTVKVEQRIGYAMLQAFGVTRGLI